MQSIELDGLDRLLDGWESLQRDFPGMKRELLEELGRSLLEDVRSEIGGGGQVQGWQERYVGSRNGYVAVRPKAKTYKTTAGGKQYAVGYVTNAIEGGHRTGGRRPGRKAEGYRYRPRIHKAAVPGKWTYKMVRGQLDAITQQELDQLLAFIIDGLEGRL